MKEPKSNVAIRFAIPRWRALRLPVGGELQIGPFLIENMRREGFGAFDSRRGSVSTIDGVRHELSKSYMAVTLCVWRRISWP